jgi:hypothetical protein
MQNPSGKGEKVPKRPSISRVSFFQESESKQRKYVKIAKEWCNLEETGPENNTHGESLIREEDT